ncbi:MAG: hypothetical protein AB7W59_14230 [Acidimicrobiia bacterium]
MEALIVGRTHMSTSACVGAIDLQSGRSMRLFHNSWTYPGRQDYLLGQVWHLNVVPRPAAQIRPPHVEDVLVTSRRLTRSMTLPEARAAVLAVALPWVCPLPDVFDGCVESANNKPFVGNGRVPSCSTGFWLADRPLELLTNEHSSHRYFTRQPPFWSMPYVGLDATPFLIEPGELVRLSLAGWWQGSWTPPGERCYVQVSGTFG